MVGGQGGVAVEMGVSDVVVVVVLVLVLDSVLVLVYVLVHVLVIFLVVFLGLLVLVGDKYKNIAPFVACTL